jgi:hypothetical protein
MWIYLCLSFFSFLSSLENKPDLYPPMHDAFCFSGTFLDICFERVICDIAWCSVGFRWESLSGCYVFAPFAI